MGKKYDRQIELINLLLRGGRTTVSRISAELEVSPHTVKRDIADLQFHFPIDTYAGRGGGVEMNAAFNINGYMLKQEYVKLIEYALKFLAASDDGMAEPAGRLLKKCFSANNK